MPGSKHFPLDSFIAVGFTAAVLLAGYFALGLLTMLLFTAGFAGGLLLWLVMPSSSGWVVIRAPYWATLVLFVVHRVEEKVFGFFAMLSNVTGVPTPEVASPAVVAMVVLSVGGWLAVPVLAHRRPHLATYFAWTLFTSMGVTELAHWLVFPFLQGPGLHAVPGMWSVLALAPAAWWGLSRLATGTKAPNR